MPSWTWANSHSYPKQGKTHTGLQSSDLPTSQSRTTPFTQILSTIEFHLSLPGLDLMDLQCCSLSPLPWDHASSWDHCMERCSETSCRQGVMSNSHGDFLESTQPDAVCPWLLKPPQLSSLWHREICFIFDEEGSTDETLTRQELWHGSKSSIL